MWAPSVWLMLDLYTSGDMPRVTSRQGVGRHNADPPNLRRRWIPAALAAGLLAGLVALAVAKINLAEVLNALGNVRLGWLVLAWAFTAASNLARGEAWHAVIGAALPQSRIARAPVTRALLIGAAASSVIPGRLGEAARALIVCRHLGGSRQKLATVAGTILAQTLLNLLALLILAIVVLTASTIPGARSGAVAVAIVLPLAVVVALLAVPALTGRAGSLRWAPARALAGWLSRQLVQARRGLVVFRRPRPGAHATVAQLLAWALQLACCYAVILAIGIQQRAGLGAAAAVLLAVNVTAILPVTPSNVGVYQAACIGVLVPFGVSAGHALAYGLILQAVEVLSGLSLGLPALAREGVSLLELRRQVGGAQGREATPAHAPPEQTLAERQPGVSIEQPAKQASRA